MYLDPSDGQFFAIQRIWNNRCMIFECPVLNFTDICAQLFHTKNMNFNQYDTLKTDLYYQPLMKNSIILCVHLKVFILSNNVRFFYAIIENARGSQFFLDCDP